MATAYVPLETLASEIRGSYELAEKAHTKYLDLRVSAAMRTLEAKRRVDAGEAGPGVKFDAWATLNLQRSRSYIYKQLKIATAKDPAAEAATQRAANREHNQASRDRQQVSHVRDQSPASDTRNDNLSSEDPIAVFERAWLLIPDNRRDEALRRIGARRVEVKGSLPDAETAPDVIKPPTKQLNPVPTEPADKAGMPVDEDAADEPPQFDGRKPSPAPSPLLVEESPTENSPPTPASEPTIMAAWEAIPEEDKNVTHLWVFWGCCLGQAAPASTPRLFADRYCGATEPEQQAFRAQLMELESSYLTPAAA